MINFFLLKQQKLQKTPNWILLSYFNIVLFSSFYFHFIPKYWSKHSRTFNSTFSHTSSYLFVKLQRSYWLNFPFRLSTEHFIQSLHTTSPFSAQHRPRVRPVDFNFILNFSFNVWYKHTHSVPVATVECALHCHSIKNVRTMNMRKMRERDTQC